MVGESKFIKGRGKVSLSMVEESKLIKGREKVS